MTSENICRFHIFFLIFCTLNVNIVAATGELLKKYISEPQAICNDNSRATFYIGTKASKKWIVFFESGGFCSSFADCNRRYLSENSTMLMTSSMLPERITGRDLLSASRSENPAFFQYNPVLVPYCSSDLWLGLKTNPNKPFSFVNDSFVDNFSFRGQTIFRSVFADLLRHHDLADAEEIILAGSSAGGIGVLNHADWVLKHVAETNTSNARLTSLIDSAWFIDFQGSLRDMVNPEFASFANISSRACFDNSPGHTCCPSATCMIARGYYPASVPLLLISSMYDVYMFGEVLKKLEAEGKTADEYSADYISALNMYGGAMNESLSSLNVSFFVSVVNESLSSLNVSFFIPACFQHIYFATSSLWDEDGIFPPSMEVSVANAKFRNTVQREYWEKTKVPIGSKKISIKDFVTTWAKSPDGSMKVIDSCIGAQCNPTCPKQLFFIDPAVNWVEVVKTGIIILSLFITVTCFGLKVVFMLYQYYLLKKQKQYLTETETKEVHKELPPAQPDEAISIACLALSYSVEVRKRNTKKKKEKAASEPKEVETDRPLSISSPLVMKEDTEDVFEEEKSTSISSESPENEPTEEIDSYPNHNLGFEGSGSSTHTHEDFFKTKAYSNRNSISYSQHNRRERIKKEKTGDGPHQKPILRNVSVYFNPGELVAIMGPSGSGKTTLLDLLTGRREKGSSQGAVFINGVPRSLGNVHKWYARKIGYVLQLAVPYYEELTVRQNLFFAAHMRLPKSMSNAKKFERVEQILAEIGLTSLADTVVGGSVGQGLSGGQKRRLCVALQMINLPSVLFLDEPTSGLDASSSLELLNHLNLVAESGRLVILTIHQPRLEIFHLFHKIILMYDGQVAYYGDPTLAPTLFLKAYLKSTTEEFQLSEDAPKIDATNPADMIMDIMNCSEARRAILDFYQRSGEPQAVQEAIKMAKQNAMNTFAILRMNSDKKEVNDAGTFNRTFVLEARTSLRQTLGQILYFPFIFFMFGLVIGTIYFRAQDEDGILLISALCVYCCASPLFLSSVLMAHLNKALNIYHLERADGCGRSYENVVQTYVGIAALCVIPNLVCSAMSYFLLMTSYELSKFLLLTVISLVLNQTWIAVYMMVICAHPGIAHRICPMVSAMAGFAGGFVVPRPQMPSGYNLLFYINPQFYGYSAISKVLLQNVRLKCVYESSLNCISTDGNAVLARFGFDTVNIYEHLVIMLGMTVISLLFSWLFLEIKNIKIKFSKTSSKISRSQVDKVFHESIELLNGAHHTINPTRRKSTLGIVTHDDGLHTVKLPDSPIPSESRPESDTVSLTSKTSSVSSRKNRWSSVCQRTAERKRSSHLEMKHVQRIARQSSLMQSKQVESREVRTRKQPVPLPRTTRSSSVPEASETKATTKRTHSYHEATDHNLTDSALKMTTFQSASSGVEDHGEASLSKQLRSVTFSTVEEGDQEMISGHFCLESICEHDDALGSEEEEGDDTANVFVNILL